MRENSFIFAGILSLTPNTGSPAVGSRAASDLAAMLANKGGNAISGKRQRQSAPNDDETRIMSAI